MLTNTGLVEHVKMALSEKWGYVWGTFGNVLTPNIFKEKIRQYPDGVGKYTDFIMANWVNKRTADCVGLIKSYMWWKNNQAVYNASTDVTANSMFINATEKGELKTLQEIPGLCLWMDGHIGVYIGNGQVVEARGTMYGVIQSPLKGKGSSAWTHWLKCPYISYNCENAKDLQTKLNILGYNLVVDGIIGPRTQMALINFQDNNGLVGDGIITTETISALDKMILRLEGPKRKDYIQIINEISSGSADAWIKGIDTAVAAAKADGNLGALEIFQHLPLLIEKIGNKKS